MSPLLLPLLAVILVGGTTVFFFRAAFALRLPKDRTVFVVGWLLGAALGVSALTQEPGTIAAIGAGFATFLGVLFPILVAISPQKVAPGAITVGATLPAFTAPDEHGGTFDSSNLDGRPTLIKFFRGHW